MDRRKILLPIRIQIMQEGKSTSYTLMANSIETKNYPLAILAPHPYSLLPDIVTVLIFFNLKLKRTLVSLGMWRNVSSYPLDGDMW